MNKILFGVVAGVLIVSVLAIGYLFFSNGEEVQKNLRINVSSIEEQEFKTINMQGH